MTTMKCDGFCLSTITIILKSPLDPMPSVLPVSNTCLQHHTHATSYLLVVRLHIVVRLIMPQFFLAMIVSTVVFGLGWKRNKLSNTLPNWLALSSSFVTEDIGSHVLMLGPKHCWLPSSANMLLSRHKCNASVAHSPLTSSYQDRSSSRRTHRV